MKPLLVLALVCGCSLSSISELDLRECASDEDCAPLNEADRIDVGACVLWQCSSARACELRERDQDDDGEVAIACGGMDCDDSSAAARPGGSEVCDGLDNDCNGLNDDGDIEPSFETVVTGVPDPTWSLVSDGWLAYPATDGVGLSDLASSGAPTSVAFVRDESFSSPAFTPGCHSLVERVPMPPTSAVVGATDETCQTHAECDDAVLCNGFETCEPRSPDADSFGCRAEGAPACPGATCDEAAHLCRELSTDLACSPSEIAFAPSGPDRSFVAAINDVGCAAGQLRVGLLDADARTIRQRGDARRTALWPAVGECSGASAPAMASILPNPDAGRLRPQALLAWVADCHDAPCVADPRVELMGLWDEEATAGGEPVGWTHGTLSLELQSIRPGSRPALVAIDDEYHLAYPAADGGVWVHRIAAQADPSEVVGSAPYRTRIDPDGGARSAGTLLLDEPVRVLRNRSVRELALAVGPNGQVGLAWIDDDGTFFARVVADAVEGTERIGETGAELAVLGAMQNVVGAMDGETGGWIATWIARGEVHFRRVDADGRSTGVARRLGTDARVPRPFLDSAGVAGVVFHAGEQAAFVRSEGLCGFR